MADRATPLMELGRRLSACRREAALDVEELAGKAYVPSAAVERFERGGGGLGVAALSRLAKVLGISPGSVLLTSTQREKALTEPSVLLKSQRAASVDDRDREALSDALVRARTFSRLGILLNVEHLADRFLPTPPPKDRAHEAGYESARKVRALLPERPGALRGLSRLIENRFDILVIELRFSHPAVFGASCRSGAARVIALGAALRSETTRRFVLGHELGHHLMDLESEGTTVDEHSLEGPGFWMANSPAEKRANAFAAMLLAPAHSVRDALGAPKADGYGLREARELVRRAQDLLGVGFAAMAWHLHNLGYFRSPDTVQALLVSPDSNDIGGFEDECGFDGLRRRVYELHEREGLSAARERELLGTAGTPWA